MNIVFSYGTLTDKFNKKGREALLYTYYRMSSYGPYPALVKDEDKHLIEGVVLSLTDSELKEADTYEGYPGLYNRERQEVIFRNGIVVRAWVYFLNEKIVETNGNNPYLG